MRNIIGGINEELDKIERKEGVRILHAVESGSRAWGFASPDSDYDVRFVYVRPKEDYLRLDEPKDVIEWQLDEVLDINGWDLKKALRQFAKGNVTLFEWSESPIVYRTTAEWAQIKEISKHFFSEKAAVCHYYGTANNTLQKYLLGDLVRYKKYFYALRPLLAARYIETYHTAPPVLFDDLLKMDMPEVLRRAVDELLDVKKVTAEGEENPQIPIIRGFIVNETARQKKIANNMRDDRNKDYARLNRIFIDIVLGMSIHNGSIRELPANVVMHQSPEQI
ncbi:nucleotidyltransferase domain-containing protein [Hornefia butyriciproducens]|uniref:nucleotidyltransferase domain-containing protein n=1 Tax=Hornefia butyriciproducens TaxID=2652293 RepID=UPI002A9205D2|nr:nucleotidyltransferase domain-containing protein [Hornefia butyriciproducens]MDY6212022.1 nucleotidyltransferase domain-containing protein [Hornefia butyriciproducens]